MNPNFNPNPSPKETADDGWSEIYHYLFLETVKEFDRTEQSEYVYGPNSASAFSWDASLVLLNNWSARKE